MIEAMRGLAILVTSALLALGLGACGQEQTLHGDLAFSADERAQITAAAEDWRQFSNGAVSYRVVFDGARDGHRIVRAAPGSSAVEAADAAFGEYGVTVGWYIDGDVFLAPERIPPSQTLKSVAAHEMGHASGLGHIHKPGSIMSSWAASSFSIHDLEECRLAGVCE